MARGDIPAEVSNMLRWGTVIAVRTAAPARVRVQTGEIQTDWIAWLERRAGPNGRTWHAPGKGEQVLLACPDGDISQAVIIGSTSQDAYPQPASSEDVDRTTYPDGSVVEFNHATSTLSVHAGKGQVIVNCQQAEVHASAAVVLDSPTVHATGSVMADGNVSAGTGATGTFTTGTGQVVSVERGSVTNIY
ncbi:phage baseplate assembly protein V [Stenotrophomonas maltophilia]|uniref:phage baseplate assembly protein V n=1 Tax=Bacteria TaxID=2 RepID=UPI00068A97CE|nr:MULTISPECIES: phage baseplate assembly protein V [Stenotrophomonas]MBA0371158.1 phage baseplate assembly protein V [Stenotrophomonas maltophilia]MBH1558489.1 phage baseplate assembly protein V [Stenotrophomonas maltophilia]MCI1140309.1 phage baseplate assembly protein V [Stenotrophomonas maltophilia]HDX0800952.1 phage baseplate assembly protein V [Stenotrophomonas maltophilia]HDX0814885.1 phage baseplate assembly protein V [Stenotrophomonas maltophilia]